MTNSRTIGNLGLYTIAMIVIFIFIDAIINNWFSYYGVGEHYRKLFNNLITTIVMVLFIFMFVVMLVVAKED